MHIDAGGKMINFGDWEMPINYGSQISEHNQVRTDAGMFDVSHMCVIDITGAQAQDFLQKLIANDVAKLKTPGKALYSCMLNQSGGVIDDLIVYYLNDSNYRIVVNAATREIDILWIDKQIKNFNSQFKIRDDLAIIAVQGKNAREKFFEAMPGSEDICKNVKPFNAVNVGELFIARTGYTGEDGFEIILPSKSVEFCWKMLLEAGVKPCGLGARDTLRLEAGMSLYGSEMDENTTPLESALDWTLDFSNKNRDFIGREALEKQDAKDTIVGLVLEGKGIIRSGQEITSNLGDGIITSGSFSPTMGQSIALARVKKGSTGMCKIQIRDKQMEARIVKPPFVRNGKILV